MRPVAYPRSISVIEILRQLECSMADLTQPYDELAAHYDQIFENWEASIARQATVLAGILDRECGDRRPIRVLDCACGIGTQSLGLAMKGFDVTGCDISVGAVQRARSEASKRELSVPFSVANMVQLSAIPKSSFDAVICIDNSLPDLQTDEDLLQAAQQAYGKLRPGGSFIGSIRDYDRLVVERPTTQGPSFYSDDGSRHIVFQIWDWLDERRYRFHLYITRNTQSAWQTFHFTSTYRAVLRSELQRILEEAGFINIRWLSPSDSGFYQLIFIANRNC
jgi:glycine/sarcosine N-methyltransferase